MEFLFTVSKIVDSQHKKKKKTGASASVDFCAITALQWDLKQWIDVHYDTFACKTLYALHGTWLE